MTKIADFTADELTTYFEYLDDLRDSGETNMFGAGSYLMRDYDMGRAEAHAVLKAWMDTFSDTLPPADRAMNAVEASA